MNACIFEKCLYSRKNSPARKLHTTLSTPSIFRYACIMCCLLNHIYCAHSAIQHHIIVQYIVAYVCFVSEISVQGFLLLFLFRVLSVAICMCNMLCALCSGDYAVGFAVQADSKCFRDVARKEFGMYLLCCCLVIFGDSQQKTHRQTNRQTAALVRRHKCTKPRQIIPRAEGSSQARLCKPARKTSASVSHTFINSTSGRRRKMPKNHLSSIQQQQ